MLTTSRGPTGELQGPLTIISRRVQAEGLQLAHFPCFRSQSAGAVPGHALPTQSLRPPSRPPRWQAGVAPCGAWLRPGWWSHPAVQGVDLGHPALGPANPVTSRPVPMSLQHTQHKPGSNSGPHPSVPRNNVPQPPQYSMIILPGRFRQHVIAPG